MAVEVHGKVHSLFTPSNSDRREIRLDACQPTVYDRCDSRSPYSFLILYNGLPDTPLAMIPRNFFFHNFESVEDISVLLDEQSRNSPAK